MRYLDNHSAGALSVIANTKPALAAACLLLALANPAAAANITREDWGTTQGGEKVDLYVLKGAKGMEARIATFGGVLVNLMVPDRSGHVDDVVLGNDDFGSYEKGGFYGALIGRFANRINNASFPLEGRTVNLDHRGPNLVVLHSGAAGFNRRVWGATPHDGAEPSLELKLVDPDGSGGMPGTVTATVTYTLTSDNALKIDYRATTDKPTVANLTNHSYFNIAGQGSGVVDDQMLQLFADQYTPSDDKLIPTGQLAPVKGTPIDFTAPTRVGTALNSTFPEIVARRGMDINFVLRGTPGTLRPAARLEDPKSGRVMEVLTTQPGIQIFSDNRGGPAPGKGGKTYVSHDALTFETQHFPDSPNQPSFPSTEITPDKPLHEIAVYRFSILR
jgi:aldose 1-epimerase